MIEHHSGRPWIVGCWNEEDLVVTAVGPHRVALLGRTTADAALLTRQVRDVRSVRDLDHLAATAAGSFHLVASIDGEVRVQGTVSTACQTYYATVAGVTLAADRPQALADRIGASIDEDQVALALLSPFGPPWPLSERSLWRGVCSPAAGHCLEIGRDGTGRTRQWWTAPEPYRPLGNGDTIRQALTEAVASCTAGQEVVSADMSGGLDSTSLCFLADADRHDAHLVTVHYQALGRSDDDRYWTQAEAALPGARHLLVGAGQAPDWYAPLTHAVHDREGPLTFVRTRATIEHSARLAAAHGSRRHLQGLNGDELFHPSLMALHALARRQPLTALPHLRALRSMRRWSLTTTGRTFASSPSYAQWLAACSNTLTEGHDRGTGADWEPLPKLPPWATPHAAATVRRHILDALAATPQPLAALPVQHEMIRLNRVNGNATRRSSHIGAHTGVTFHAPFTDDRVLEAILSVRLEDRVALGQFKPMLGTALRGIVPAGLLSRTTKADASAELYAGVRRRRGELLKLMDDSHLVRMGLVDASILRTVLRGLHADTRPLMPLDSTLACELWLRSLSPADTARTTAVPVPSPRIVKEIQ
ncbi:asparagine synthase-related protein [Streptomyces sp. NBC_00868]|uniref:asparagine synthase-related protein n=1 Tax=Streptomyces sp. NBC_00122 TaxID=2903623 RepID=UPI0032438920|nr:asparagine synthase-related protein [Streptomyces sp. NBC_00868]